MEKIKVHIYEDSYREEWDSFVHESNIGTIFHKQVFLDYHNPGKFKFYNLMLRRGSELVGVLPGGLKGEGNDIFWSPVGASYGSVVVKDIAYSHSLEIIDSLLAFGRESNWKEMFLIPPPFIYNKVYNQHLEYSMLFRKFDFENHYISHAVNLRQGRNYFDNFDAKTRYEIRNIKRKGLLHVEESTDYSSYYPILLDNKSRHNVLPTHSLKDLLRLKELMPNQIKLFLVYLDEKPIAGSILFLANSKVALCFYIMMDYEYKQYKPVHLCMDHICQWSVENGYDWLDIGVSQDTAADNPMTPAMSLIYFKERFNARGIFRSTFHYQFL